MTPDPQELIARARRVMHEPPVAAVEVVQHDALDLEEAYADPEMERRHIEKLNTKEKP